MWLGSKYWDRFQLLLLSTLVFLPNLVIPYLGGDESARHTICREAFTGGLYTQVTNNKPPLEPQINFLITLGGHAPILDHVFFILWIFIGALALRYLLQEFFTREAAHFAALFFVAFSAMANYGAGANERMFIPFLLLAAALVLWRRKRSLKPWPNFLIYLAIGALCACATLIKQTAFLFVMVVVLWDWLYQPKISKVILSALGLFIGGTLLTLISWLATGVDFTIILREAYLVNLDYVKAPLDPERSDALKNSLYMLGYQLLPLTLLGLAGFYFSFKEKNWKGRWREALLLCAWILVSIAAVVGGFRFQQPYFLILLPLLACGAARAYEHLSTRKYFVLSSALLAALIVGSYQTYIWWAQMTDRNPYWDSKVRSLIQEVKNDTSPDDSIWVSHSLFPVYVMTERKPGQRHLFFLSLLGQIDICKAPDSALQENTSLRAFQEGLHDLNTRKPKVIFWVERAKNGCSDRIKLENFPSIQGLIIANYQKVWHDPGFGTYYRRRDQESKPPEKI